MLQLILGLGLMASGFGCMLVYYDNDPSETFVASLKNFTLGAAPLWGVYIVTTGLNVLLALTP